MAVQVHGKLLAAAHRDFTTLGVILQHDHSVAVHGIVDGGLECGVIGCLSPDDLRHSLVLRILRRGPAIGHLRGALHLHQSGDRVDGDGAVCRLGPGHIARVRVDQVHAVQGNVVRKGQAGVVLTGNALAEAHIQRRGPKVRLCAVAGQVQSALHSHGGGVHQQATLAGAGNGHILQGHIVGAVDLNAVLPGNAGNGPVSAIQSNVLLPGD